MFDTRMVAATSATVSRWSPACRPTQPLCDRLAIVPHLHRSLREVPIDVRLADPVVLPHADRRQLAALDQPVHGHVRDPHRGRDLAHREEPVTDERSPLAHLAHLPHLPQLSLLPHPPHPSHPVRRAAHGTNCNICGQSPHMPTFATVD